MPRAVSASAPGRVNVLGNPTDGLEGAYAVISTAIAMRARVVLRRGGGFRFSGGDSGFRKLAESALRVLERYFPEYAERVAEDPPDVEYSTEIPPESGLAGSTALTAAFLAALRCAYGFDRRKLNDYILAELVQRAEEGAGVMCGYADRYACVMGGLAYMDFRGKLYHKPLRMEPLATYERLDAYVDYLPVLICYLGVRRSSGEVHARFRSAYMRELEKVRRGERSELVALMRRVGLTAMKGKYALLEQDWEEFGRLMNLNHRLVDRAMRLAGFEEGAGYYNNAVIEYALRIGALGAKLSGAGGGGSVIVLAEPEREKALAEELAGYMRSLSLINSRVYALEISKAGAEARPLE